MKNKEPFRRLYNTRLDAYLLGLSKSWSNRLGSIGLAEIFDKLEERLKLTCNYPSKLKAREVLAQLNSNVCAVVAQTNVKAQAEAQTRAPTRRGLIKN